MKKLITAVLVAGMFVSCSEKKVYTKQTYEEGIKAYLSKNYEKAQELLKNTIYEWKNISIQEAMAAKFALADSYFHRKMYIDAIVEFEEYVSMYPTSPKVPEAIYKLAVSYLKIAPSEERDLTYVRTAEKKAMELINDYPDSKYAELAKEILKKARTKEAKHFIKVADLYEHLKKYYSAAVYYNYVYDEFTDYIKRDYIEYKLAYNLLNVDKQYEKEIKEYKEKIKELEKKIAGSKDLSKKRVYENRKKVLENHLKVLENRIKEGKERGIAILENAYKMYPKSKYRDEIKKLLKKYKEVNNHRSKRVG